MEKELVKLANHLDLIGLRKEADYIDALLKKEAANNILQEFLEDLAASLSNVFADVSAEIAGYITDAIISCTSELTTLFPPNIPSEEEIKDCAYEKVKEKILDGTIPKDTFDVLIASGYAELKRLFDKYKNKIPSLPSIPGF